MEKKYYISGQKKVCKGMNSLGGCHRDEWASICRSAESPFEVVGLGTGSVGPYGTSTGIARISRNEWTEVDPPVGAPVNERDESRCEDCPRIN